MPVDHVCEGRFDAVPGCPSGVAGVSIFLIPRLNVSTSAAVIGEGPGALLFIHELTRNALPVIRGVDQIGQEYE